MVAGRFDICGNQMSIGHRPRGKLPHRNRPDDCSQRRNKTMVVVDSVDYCANFGNVRHPQIVQMSPQEFAKKIQTTVANVERDVPNLLLLGGKLLEGEMKQRIFNQGGDANGGKIGKYKSKSWIDKRTENGRQTGTVDLEFTGSLRDSIQVVKSGDEVFLAITNSTDYVKAKGQESRRKKPIFIPTAGERQDVENYLSDLISERVLSYF